ncbi:MAG: helix-turn-helix transcriptional regulator [Blastocatellia bacterium]
MGRNCSSCLCWKPARATATRCAGLIETRSDGVLKFNAASLYPLLYRLEKRGWIEGRWVEKAGQRRRRYYKLTRDGKKVLAAQRTIWQSFVAAINRVTGIEHA